MTNEVRDENFPEERGKKKSFYFRRTLDILDVSFTLTHGNDQRQRWMTEGVAAEE